MSNNFGNKQTMANNILYYMKIHNKSRNDMCNALSVSYSTFSDWVNAKKYPRIDKIELMASYFNISKADLVEEPTEKKSKFLIPVLGYVRAGIPIEAVEEILDYEEISEDMARQGEYFALIIRGDSMEPRMREGDVVIIRKQSIVDNGDIAVVLVNGDDATIKKFYKYDNGVHLIPFNTSYEPIIYTPEEVNNLPVQVIGKVVELRAKF